MAPKSKYTRNAISNAAAQAAEHAKAELNSAAIRLLTCDQIEGEEKCDQHNRVYQTSHITFRWHIALASGYDTSADVAVLCKNVMKSGVPLPEHWDLNVKFLGLGEATTEAASKVHVPGFTDVRAEVLGRAKFVEPATVDGPAVGKVVALNVEGCRKSFFLCARVKDDEWLCHGGSFVDGALAENPFDERDLVTKNIVADAWDSSRTKAAPWPPSRS